MMRDTFESFYQVTEPTGGWVLGEILVVEPNVEHLPRSLSENSSVKLAALQLPFRKRG